MPRMILVVDDNAMNRLLLKNTICRDYDVIEAENGKEALALMHKHYKILSAVLLDIVMPEMTGYDVLRAARENPLMAQIPIIMVTGSEDEESRVKALTLGANDFILKPFNPEIVKHCIKNNIALRETASILNAIQKDKLTGLYNRETFFEKVSAAVKQREPGYYILSCFDIDSFKLVNDRFGAAEGDRILRDIGRVVREDMETVGGVGGRISSDNFAALLPAASKEFSIIRILQQNRMAFSDKQAIVFSVGRYVITDLSLPASAMYDRAFIAKRSIKGRYDEHIAYFSDQMLEKLVSDQQIITDMDEAIAGHQFEIWFQPQYNHSTSALIGAEALVRWRHPTKGLIPPNVFIPVFEQNGFIYELDKYVWEETCRYLRRELDAARSPLPVSVNISRYDMFRPDFLNALTGLMAKYDIPLELLRLEVTESAFAESTKHIITVVKKLIDLGFTVEIDDFGSGYSSLNTLKSVPAQVIKLDMRFFEDDEDSQRSGNIIESVVRMSKWLGMSVIAEGVEKIEQADYLRSIGCDYIQGYLYAKPMPESSYRELSGGVQKEKKLLTMNTVENMDNSSFWDPKSMDTLIFNSYVGAACIFEYHHGKIEMLRATQKYAQILGDGTMSIGEALRVDWEEHIDAQSNRTLVEELDDSAKTKEEKMCEFLFYDLPGCPHETYLRCALRVIASTGDRYLVYCNNENITAQKNAEQRERDTANQMRLIMQNVNGGVCAAAYAQDGSVRILFANDKFYALYGYTKEQFDSELHSALDAIHPEDRAKTMSMIEQVVESRRSATIEYRCVKRDGSVIHVNCNNAVFSMAGVSDAVLLSITTDITEITRIRDLEKQNTERLNAVMHDIGSGISAVTITDGNVNLVFSNDKFYEMRGYTKENYGREVINFHTTVHPDDRQRMYRCFLDAYASEQPGQVEYRLIHRDGSVHWIRMDFSSTRFTGIDRNVLLCIYTDITEMRKSEQTILDTSTQLQAMMDDIPGGFARMRMLPDGSMNTVFINEGLCKLTGMTHEEMVALYARDAMAGVHPDDVQIVRDAVEQMLKNGKAYSSRYRLLRKGGGYVWLSIFGRITADRLGTTYLNIYYSDVTQQVRMEEQEKERGILTKTSF